MAEITFSRTGEELTEAILENPKVLYEYLLKGIVNTGSITLPVVHGEQKGRTVTIPFILTSDFSFNLQNSWKELLPQDINNFIGNAFDWYNRFTAFDTKGLTLKDDGTPYNNAQIGWQNKMSSIKSYSGSSKPTFSVDMTFVCTRRSYNPGEIVKTLSSMCLPLKMDLKNYAQTLDEIVDGTSTKIKELWEKLKNKINDSDSPAKLLIDSATDLQNGIKNEINSLREQYGIVDSVYSFLESSVERIVELAESAGGTIGAVLQDSVVMAPLYYQAYYDKDLHKAKGRSGTVTLHIGNWFMATDLICNSISGITFSKETIAPPPEWLGKGNPNSIYTPESKNTNWGFPLWAKCTVTLEPCALITYEDFCEYFNFTGAGTLVQRENTDKVSGGLKMDNMEVNGYDSTFA